MVLSKRFAVVLGAILVLLAGLLGWLLGGVGCIGDGGAEPVCNQTEVVSSLSWLSVFVLPVLLAGVCVRFSSRVRWWHLLVGSLVLTIVAFFAEALAWNIS
jgi:hypothetical protein